MAARPNHILVNINDIRILGIDMSAAAVYMGGH